jgi:hypothetical protein
MTYPLDPSKPLSGPLREHPNPALLLPRLMIEQAFRCATQTVRGQPTAIALEAVHWITARTDWTRVPGEVPSESIREEHVLSFE